MREQKIEKLSVTWGGYFIFHIKNRGNAESVFKSVQRSNYAEHIFSGYFILVLKFHLFFESISEF